MGRLVELLQRWHGLPKGAEGIVSGSNGGGWVVVFGCVAITLPFEGEGVTYQFV
jgi:hypothetical protein